VTFKSLLKSDFTGSGYFKAFFSATVGFYFWHVAQSIKNDTLLAVPNGRYTYGALWEIRSNAQECFQTGGKSKEKIKIKCRKLA
jgi:hypothetical protein